MQEGMGVKYNCRREPRRTRVTQKNTDDDEDDDLLVPQQIVYPHAANFPDATTRNARGGEVGW